MHYFLCVQVHKSGSTTVANLLARYALSRDLNVALPDRPADRVRFNYFERFREDRVAPLAEGQRYHVLFNHMIYNRSALERVMPRDTFYCGIVRQPLARFLSSANYYHNMLPPRVRQHLFRAPHDHHHAAKVTDLLRAGC